MRLCIYIYICIGEGPEGCSMCSFLVLNVVQSGVGRPTASSRKEWCGCQDSHRNPQVLDFELRSSLEAGASLQQEAVDERSSTNLG